MLTSLSMIGPFILFAWILQYFLNQLIADDLESFQTNQSHSMDDASLG